ncbi:UNKNOWN [Stylonychia lemnae]|uniref:Uncharacterized protein n=1 Tax=Stylonychia lemnae TaxID=5949 RepID=A0A078ANJ7_STYLE|nr:UNKNOWN [Stylonychia lemnae]|eukprot:CDW83915.1 UNKNOWN [Stylonychia lemnae]
MEADEVDVTIVQIQAINNPEHHQEFAKSNQAQLLKIEDRQEAPLMSPINQIEDKCGYCVKEGVQTITTGEPRGRIFGQNELVGGTQHYYEECVNPLECFIHSEVHQDYIDRDKRVKQAQQKYKNEEEKEGGGSSLVNKIKQGFNELKDAILGKKEHKPDEFGVKDLDEIDENDIAQEEKIDLPVKENLYHKDVRGSGSQKQISLLRDDENLEFQRQSISDRENVSEEYIMRDSIQYQQEGIQNKEVEATLRDFNNLKQLNLEEIKQFENAPTEMYRQNIDDRTLRTGEENAILTGPRLQQTQYASTHGATTVTHDTRILNQPIQTVNILIKYFRVKLLMSNQCTLPLHLQRISNTQMNKNAFTAPPLHLEHHQKYHKKKPLFNSKNIREADLYQEDVSGSRVQANTLAGMPLTYDNRPVHELHTGGYRQPAHEHYGELHHEARDMGQKHIHTLTPTDQVVGSNLNQRLGTTEYMQNYEENPIIREAQYEGSSSYTRQQEQIYTTNVGQTAGVGTTAYTTQYEPAQYQMQRERETQHFERQEQPRNVETEYRQETSEFRPEQAEYRQMEAGYRQEGAEYRHEEAEYRQEQTGYNKEQYGFKEGTQFTTLENPEVTQFSHQERVPNECEYCRNEEDVLPHKEHVSRGWLRPEYVPFERQDNYAIQSSAPLIQTAPTARVTDAKLPFGGTKPGQYMAQEIPILYGWGAAPSQRLYKSNEVVGMNYAGPAMATKPHKSSRADKKADKKIHKEAVKEAGQHKLEQEYQGNIMEQTAETKNKIFQNVHEPIDSTIVENKLH